MILKIVVKKDVRFELLLTEIYECNKIWQRRDCWHMITEY